METHLGKESLLSVGSHTTEDWAVGDRCYAGGTKAGTIAFIGEVKFQPGEWAGVILDEAAGKNDGSVAGIRYFQCSANRGLFCKLNRLTRHSMEKPQLPSGPKMSTEQMLNLTGSSEYQGNDTNLYLNQIDICGNFLDNAINTGSHRCLFPIDESKLSSIV